MNLIADIGHQGALLLQGLVAVLMALSVTAVWVAFRRRPMAYWALTWWVLAGAVVMSSFASTSAPAGKLFQSMLGLGLWLAVAPMVHGAAASLAGKPPSPRRFLGLALAVAAVGLSVASLLVPLAGRWFGPGRMALGAIVITHGPVVMALAATGLMILLLARDHPRAAGLTLIGVSVIMLAGRTTLWVLPGSIGASPELRAKIVAVTSLVQLVTIVLLGLSTLAALLSEERAAALARERQWNRVERLDSLGQMAGGIVHDFNNVLAAVRNGVELARLEVADQGRVSQDLGEVERAAVRGQSLVAQLLRFARREAGVMVPIELGGAIGELRRMLDHLLGPRHQLVYVKPSGALWVRADQPRFEQALVNLVTNARDAMASGGRVTLAVEGRELTAAETMGSRTLGPGRYVVTSVQDTGSGIEPSILPQIFDPFVTGKDHGTGLGLSNVAAAIDEAAGGIRVSTQVGVGTRFELWLPAIAAPGPAELPRAVMEGASAG